MKKIFNKLVKQNFLWGQALGILGAKISLITTLKYPTRRETHFQLLNPLTEVETHHTGFMESLEQNITFDRHVLLVTKQLKGKADGNVFRKPAGCQKTLILKTKRKR